MILVDTSVWTDYLRSSEAHLSEILNEGRVCMHPHVLGEVALSSLNNRAIVLESMRDIPQAAVATEDEVCRFIGDHALFGLSIGYTDAHLLAAAKLSPGTQLWTGDRRLSAASIRLGFAYALPH